MTRYRRRSPEVEVHFVGDDLSAACQFATERGARAEIREFPHFHFTGIRIYTPSARSGTFLAGPRDVIVYDLLTGEFDILDTADFAEFYEKIPAGVPEVDWSSEHYRGGTV